MIEKKTIVPIIDKVWYGLVIGLALPTVVYAVFLMIQEQLISGDMNGFQPRTLVLLSICSVIIPMLFFKRHHAENAMRGIVIATVLGAGLWFFLFFKEVF